MLLMLIDTADRRHAGEPDGPDDERERRWEPLDRALFVPAAASVSCLIVSAVTDPLISLVLVVGALAFCAQFVRVALRDCPDAAGERSGRAGDGGGG
jgi:hypothetical protein